MTVAATAPSITYNGNGATVAFTVPFRFLDDDDLTVTNIDSAGGRTPLVKGTHFTVVGEGTTAGGTVTLVTATATGATLEIVRDMDLTQTYDPRAQGSFSSSSLASALDRQAMLIQQLDARIDDEVALNASLAALMAAQTAALALAPISVSLTAFGLGASGTSATAALTAAAVYVNARGGGVSIWCPPGSYTLDATISFSSLQGLEIRGSGRNVTYFTWTGIAGIPMFRVTNSQHVMFRDFTLVGKAAAPPSEAFDMYFNSVPSYAFVNTVNAFHDLRIGDGTAAAFTIGIRVRCNVAGSDFNNDEYFYSHVRIRGCVSACVSIEHGQAKDHVFFHPQFQDSARGIWTGNGSGAFLNYGGAFHIIGGLISGMTVAAIDMGTVTGDAISITGLSCEASALFYNEWADGRQMRPVTFKACRVQIASSYMDSDKAPIRLRQAGPYNIEGCIIGYDCATKIKISNNSGPNNVVRVVGNEFAGWTASVGAAEVSPIVIDSTVWGDITLEGNAYVNRLGQFAKRAECIDTGVVYNQGVLVWNSSPRGFVLKLDYTAFKYTTATGTTGVAALTKDLLLMSPAARSRIKSMYLRCSTAGAGTTTLALIVGSTSGGNEYLTTLDAKATGYYGVASGAGASLVAGAYQGSYVPSMTAPSSLYIRATASVENLSELSAGVWYLHVECDRPGSDVGTT